LARKKEEERVAAEAEKQRQLEAKREKQAFMARYEADAQQQQQNIQGKGAEQKKEVTKGPVHDESAPVALLSTSHKPSPSLQMTTERSGDSMPLSKAKKVVSVDQLSYYIKIRSRKGVTNISPIFDLLQNKRTLEKGRRLLILEADTYTCKEEYNELIAQRTRLEKGIEAEENNIKKSEEEIADLERKTSSKWAISIKNIFGKTVEKVLEKEDELVDEELKNQLAQLNSERSGVNGNEVSALTDDDEKTDEESTSDVFAAVSPATLEDLIDKCAALLTCSPSEYTLWLHSEGIKTIEDLWQGVIDGVDKFVKGDGRIGISPESGEAFTTIVLSAMSAKDSGNQTSLPEKKELTKEEKEKLEQREREKRAKSKCMLGGCF
jgi:hypothetical protein